MSKPGEFLHLLEMTSFCEPDVQNQFGFPQLLARSLEKKSTAAEFSTTSFYVCSQILLLKLVFSGKFSQSFENKIKKEIKKAVG